MACAERFITLLELTQLCDMPEREHTGMEVSASIRQFTGGYSIVVRDGVNEFVLGQNASPRPFRCIEDALELLTDVPHLQADVSIDLRHWNTH